MNEIPREILRRVVAKHGGAVYTDARKCQNLLNDLCGEYEREINVLIAALEQRVPLDLLAGARTMPVETLLSRLQKRLEEQTALTNEAARWAVESWAAALSLLTEGDLRSRQTRHHGSTATGVPVPEPPAAKPAELRPYNPTEANRPPVKTSAPPRNSAPTVIPRTSPIIRSPGPGPHQGRTGPAAHTSSLPGAYSKAGPGIGGNALRWFRGCLVAIVLLVLAAAVAFVGVPYAISVMRETQREKNAEPPRFPTR